MSWNRFTLETCHEVAKQMKGKCLSRSYINYTAHLLWECDKGHQWNAGLQNIKNQGFWCPHCAGNARITIEWFKQHAISKGGLCLSATYKNQKSPLEFQCKCGYQWTTTGVSVRNEGCWCPKCAGVIKPTIQTAHDLATSHNGFCLSDRKSTRLNSSH